MDIFNIIFGKEDDKKEEPSSDLFSFLSKASKDNDSDFTEKEIKNMDLEDWQKDLIRSGEYDPYDFEEDSIDEDSYYNEDDDDNNDR